MSFGIGTRTAIDVGLGGIIAFKTDPWGGSVFDNAAAAYSVRVPAGSTYNNPLLRVRRSSDNTEQDIYASALPDANGNKFIDTTALLAFVGTNSGFVTTWYDQTGNARHATQTTASNQPRIVNAGVVDVVNGFPSLYATSLPYLDIAAGFPGITAATGCAVYTQSGGTPTGASPWWIGDVTSGLADHWPWVAGEVYSSFFSASRQVLGPYDGGNNTLLIAGAVQDGSNLAIYRNGSLVNSVAVAAAVPNGARLFSGASPGPSYLSEAVILPGSALAPRQILERSQGTAFGITVA